MVGNARSACIPHLTMLHPSANGCSSSASSAEIQRANAQSVSHLQDSVVRPPGVILGRW